MKYEITKGSEKDFEGAPESATVRIIENGFNDCVHIFADKFENGSTRTHCYTGVYDAYLADVSNWTVIAERRPISELVWHGEGLPPVGVEVDIVDIHERLRYGQNESGEVVAHVENTAVVRMSYGLGCFEAEFLRPIRSPEDVARDEAIAAMCDIGYTLPAAIRFSKEEMSALYDALSAGKIPGVKLDGAE